MVKRRVVPLAVASAVWLGACGSGEPTKVSADQPIDQAKAKEGPRCDGEVESSHFDLAANILPGGPQTPEEALDAYARHIYTDLNGNSFRRTNGSSSEADYSFDDPEAGELLVHVTLQGGSWHVTETESCLAAHTKRAKNK